MPAQPAPTQDVEVNDCEALAPLTVPEKVEPALALPFETKEPPVDVAVPFCTVAQPELPE